MKENDSIFKIIDGYYFIKVNAEFMASKSSCWHSTSKGLLGTVSFISDGKYVLK
jgi:hypothetical protein